MSGLVGAAQTSPLAKPDNRTLDDFYTGNEVAQPARFVSRSYDDNDPLGMGDFTSPWWPAVSGMVAATGLSDVGGSIWWVDPWTTSGCNGRLGFVGVTRDRYGSPVGLCVVRCFLASTGEMVSTTTSDVNGSFILTSQYSGAHFITVHPADNLSAGATISTLIPG